MRNVGCIFIRTKNEVMETLTHYLSEKSKEIHFIGDSDAVELFVETLKNGVVIESDAPDAVVFNNNTAIIIEHFEVDSSKSNRRGSSSKREEKRIEKEGTKALNNNKKVYFDRINAEISYENYLKNVFDNFLNHYKKINVYKENVVSRNLIKKDINLKTMFLIDDVSPMGTFGFNDNSSVEPIFLARSPEFLEFLKDKQNLDYILCCSSTWNYKYVWFIDVFQLDLYKKSQLDYKNLQMPDRGPMAAIGEIKIKRA